MSKSILKKKGFVLTTVILLSLTFIIIILPLISWSVNEFSWTNRSFMSLRALNLADAGAEEALWEIVHNSAQFTGWGGANPKTLEIPSFTDAGGAVIGDIGISADNTEPGHYLIISVGRIPTTAQPQVTKTVKVKVFPHPLFNNGVFGFDSVTMSGNAVTDSYDSSAGPYSSSNAKSNGDVGTNGQLSLEDNSIVKGDVLVGPDGTVSGDISTHVTGEPYYSGNEVEMVEPPSADFLTNLPSSGNLAVSGNQVVTLPSGNYHYDNISVDGKAKLTLSANTNIYVGGTFYTGGTTATVYTESGVVIYIGGSGDFAGQGIVNPTGDPSNLQIYGVGTASISYTGQSDFTGVVYAPHSSVYMAGNANVYGSVVGKDVTLAGNIKFHYDEALSENGPFSGYDISYWQED